MVQRTDLNLDNPLAADLRAPIAASVAGQVLNQESQRSNARRIIAEIRNRLGDTNNEQVAAILRDIDSIEAEVNNPLGDFSNIAERLNNIVTATDTNTRIARSNTEAHIADAIDARVNARLRMIDEGRIGDYYFDMFDREGRYTAEGRAFLGERMDRDPELQASAARVSRLPRAARGRAERAREEDIRWLDQTIEETTDPTLRRQLIEARELGLIHDPAKADAFRAAFASGNTGQVTQLLDEGYNDLAATLGRSASLRPGATSYNSLMQIPELRTADGRSLDLNRVARYWVDNRDEIAAATNKAARGEQLTPGEARLVELDYVMTTAQANYSMDGMVFRTMREIAREDTARFEQILNTSTPAAERVQMLTEALTEQARSEGRTVNAAQIAADARTYVTLFDRNPNARAAVLTSERGREVFDKFMQDFGADANSIRIEQGLAGMGYTQEQIQQLTAIAQQAPEFGTLLNNSFLSDRPILPADRQRILYNNILTDGGPENREALSTLRYYNLDQTYAGQQIQNNIFLGTLSPEVALQQVQALRDNSLGRMQGYSSVVLEALTPEQSQVLRDAGILNGSNLNVQELIEQARVNRDNLGTLNDEQLRAITSRPWEELNGEERARRVIAQAAVRFKAVDAVQELAASVQAGAQFVGTAQESAQLRQDMDLYRRIVNVDGEFPEAEQRAAIDQLLQRQQYLRTTPDLRGRMVDYLVQLNDSTSLLRRSDFAAAALNGEAFTYSAADHEANVRASEDHAHDPIEMHNHTAEEIKAMRREGAVNEYDHNTQTRIGDQIQDVLNHMDAHDVVTAFGTLIGQHNVGHLDNVTRHEIENALEAIGKTDPSRIGNGDGRVTREELIAVLREANFTPPATAITAAGSEQTPPGSTPPAPRAPMVAGIA